MSKFDNLIREVDVTLDYFYVEFPEEQFPQVWNDPISHHSGGISPNELLKIRTALTQAAEMQAAIRELQERIEDMLKGDDAQAWKEARKALENTKKWCER